MRNDSFEFCLLLHYGGHSSPTTGFASDKTFETCCNLSLSLATALGGAWPHAGRSAVLVSWLFAVHKGQWSVWPQPESIHWAQTGLPTQCHLVWHLH